MNVKIVVTGIVCITIIEIFALSKGINGILMTGVVGTIAAAIGVTIPVPKRLR